MNQPRGALKDLHFVVLNLRVLLMITQCRVTQGWVTEVVVEVMVVVVVVVVVAPEVAVPIVTILTGLPVANVRSQDVF